MSAAFTDAGHAARSAAVSHSHGTQVGDHNTQTNVTVDAAGLPPPQRVGGQPVHNLQPASSVFVGRDLDHLDKLLSTTAPGVAVGQAAVHGLGGIGKTELALHYARSRLDRYQVVWWVRADSPDNIAVSLAGLTRRLHSASRLADGHEWAVGWLQANRGWLMVLDNVEELEHITGLLGLVQGRGDVLVTTRRDVDTVQWRRSGLEPLRLGVLARRHSVDLLCQLTGVDDPEGADRLASELGDLPLALEQAAAYLAYHRDLDYDRYRRKLADRFSRFAGDPGGGNPHRTLARVWDVTMAVVTERLPLAARVLDVLAWLAPDGLPVDLLYPLTDDPDDVRDAVAMLASYSMIDRSPTGVRVHRLVQAVTRGNQPTDDNGVAGPLVEALELLVKAVPDEPWGNPGGWPRWTELLPHIDALPADVLNLAVLWLHDRAATFRQGQGQNDTAVAQFERVLAERRRVLGDDHPDTLVSGSNLASAYWAAGRLATSIDLSERALADQRRVLGGDHPDTLITVGNLASAYRTVGRVTEAIDLLGQALPEQRRLIGDDHPHTLASRHNLASAYLTAGRVADAVDLSEQVLTDRRRVLGDDHPDTLITENVLAGAYLAAGRVAEAISRYQRVLAERQRVLGANYPDTLLSQSNLANAYLTAGRPAEAIELCERTLVEQRQLLGDRHPDTLTCKNNLASGYLAAGRVVEAIRLSEEALAEQQRVLGDDHPNTLTLKSNLAGSYLVAGRTEAAIDLYEQALADHQRLFGAWHPRTGVIADSLRVARGKRHR